MVFPPKAPIKKHVNHYHTIEYIDNYHWIRNIDDPEVMDYIKQENSFADEVLKPLKPFQDQLYAEMKSRTKEDDQSVPEKVDNYYYYERTEKDKEYEIYCRKIDSIDAQEKIYLNLNERTEKYIDLGDSDISADHSYLAYSLDFKGDEVYTIFIKNLQTEEEKEFKKENLAGSVGFANDNKGLFFDVLNEVSIPTKVYFAPNVFKSDESFLLFDEPDNTKAIYFYRTKNKKFFMISSNDKDSSEIHFLGLTKAISPESLKLFRKRKQNVLYQVYSNQEYFYILTNENGCKNFKIMRVKEEAFENDNAWEEFLPHNDSMQISHLEMYESFIVVHVRKNGFKNLMIYSLTSDKWHNLDFLPEKIHTINYHEAPDNNEFFTTILRFNYSSMVTPNTVYDYNMETKTYEIKKVQEIANYLSSDYSSTQLYVKAADGVEIPISLVYRKDLNLQNNNPLLLYGYGCYGIPTEPGFSPYALSLVEKDFIYAIAHVRGGGEFGRSWYEQGKYELKMNTFTDFIACMKFLINNNYTSNSKLAIRGGSAGGLLLGAVINMAPEIFSTAVMSVPFVDVVNTMMDPSIPLTTLEFFEFGNPIESKKFFEILASYSPYDNLKTLDSGKYPNILIITSLYDSRVAYWEPVKYTAKLRTLKQDSNLLVLKTNLEAGHGGSSGKYEYLKELSLEYAFIYYTLTQQKQGENTN